MCGRFSLLAHQEMLRERFNITEFEFDVTPHYNIAPAQKIATVIKADLLKLVGMRWGFIPFWAKDMKIGNKMINARAETVAENRVFKHSFLKKRCLIPATGFYEWKKSNDRKTPMHIRMDTSQVFAFAGIYSQWKSPSDSIILSCSIITTTPNHLMKPIHNRMPVILKPEDESIWLDPELDDTRTLQELLKPYTDKSLEAFEVSTYVNNPRNDGPMCVKPLS
jgi:putative SOS response-associated peptidase YedK